MATQMNAVESYFSLGLKIFRLKRFDVLVNVLFNFFVFFFLYLVNLWYFLFLFSPTDPHGPTKGTSLAMTERRCNMSAVNSWLSWASPSGAPENSGPCCFLLPSHGGYDCTLIMAVSGFTFKRSLFLSASKFF